MEKVHKYGRGFKSLNGGFSDVGVCEPLFRTIDFGGGGHRLLGAPSGGHEQSKGDELKVDVFGGLHTVHIPERGNAGELNVGNLGKLLAGTSNLFRRTVQGHHGQYIKGVHRQRPKRGCP